MFKNMFKYEATIINHCSPEQFQDNLARAWRVLENIKPVVQQLGGVEQQALGRGSEGLSGVSGKDTTLLRDSSTKSITRLTSIVKDQEKAA